MRSLWALFLICFTSHALLAQANEPIILNSEIEAVTVFQQGAQVTRKAQKQIPVGNQTLLFTHITQNMDPNSVQLKGTGNLTILSIAHKIDYLTDEDKSESMRQLEEQIEVIDDKISGLKASEDAFSNEKQMILANQKIGGDNTGFSLQQLQQTADFFRKRIMEINNELDRIRKEISELSKKKSKLQQQLNQERQAFAKKTSQVEVKVEAATTTTANFELTYLVNNAGWQSIYDARVQDLESPVKLVQKARITQQTGENWSQIKLTLNTGNPSRGGQVPYLNTWYVDFIELMRKGQNINARYGNQPASRNANALSEVEAVKDEALVKHQSFEVQQTLTQEEYTIDKLQNIASSGNPEVVQLRELELPAKYEYHLKPRLDKDAFLVAQVYDWDQYNLLPGELSLFNGNTYVGEAFLNTQNPDDTLELSLGRDQNIIVQRNRIKSKQEKNFLGGKRIEQFSWKIEVRNTKNTKAKIMLKEPTPVSRNSEIEVEVENISGGRLDDKTGIIKWEFSLPSGQEREFRVSYQVKYPKDRRVNF